jgi:hypothetical protein
MPYIKQYRRDELDPEIEILQQKLEVRDNEAGDLNYTLSRLVAHQFDKYPRYWRICMAIGTLACVALEFYRRAAGPYEDKAIYNNGDIKEYWRSK